MQTVYLIGNPSVDADNLPHALLSYLQHSYACIEVDPTETFEPVEGAVIIDTVQGIERVQWFDSLDDFVVTKSVSVHDYDLYLHLKLLQKLTKIKIRILGVPQGKKVEEVIDEVMK